MNNKISYILHELIINDKALSIEEDIIFDDVFKDIKFIVTNIKKSVNKY